MSDSDIVRQIEQLNPDQLISRLSSGVIQPQPEEKAEPVDKFQALIDSGIAYRRVYYRRKMVRYRDAKSDYGDDVVDLPTVFDEDDFIAEYQKKFDEYREFWLSLICDALAYQGALDTLTAQLEEMDAFREMSVDKTISTRMMRFYTAQRIADRLGIDVVKALEVFSRDSSNDDLRKLLGLQQVSKLPKSK